jgi:hypothetical protein
MQKFKILYTFSFDKKTQVDETTETVNEAGDTVKITKKVDKETPYEFCIQKPSRSLSDDAELFYNVTVSKGIQAGLMSAALLSKRFSNDGGILSEPEKEEWGNKFVARINKEIDLQRLAKKQGVRTPQEQEEYETLLKEVAILTREMQDFEVRQQSLFDVTAEARARTRTIMWWLMFLLHRKNEKGEWVPFFEGKDLEEKQWSYDDLDDEDTYPTEDDRKFNAKVVSHAVQAITLWYYGRVAKQEEFVKALTETEVKALEEKLIGTEDAPVTNAT